MIQQYRPQHLVKVRKTVVVLALLVLHSIEICVVKGTTASVRPSSTTKATTSVYDGMSLPRSQKPLLLFQRTNFEVRLPKSDAAKSRWHTSVSRETCDRFHSELPFRMIHSKINLNKIPAGSNGRHATDDAFHRFRRQHRDIKLWLSTMESNRSNDAKSNSIDSKSEQTSSTTTTTTKSNSDNEVEVSEKTLASRWNVKGLKTEANRRLDRAKKKVDQLTTRVERYKAQTNNPPVNSKQHLDFLILDAELIHASEQFREIQKFEMLLSAQMNDNGPLDIVLPAQLAEIALALNMTDRPPSRPPRGETKPKGPRQMKTTRKPYRKYTSIDNIEIRVGKKAEDNDELSTNPQYRDNDDWWMHAAGCPGSHVIIRFADRNVEPPKTTIQDAAMLAAKHSKCQGNVISVNLCRARDIKKPPLSKPGLVMIQGNVRTVSVDMKASQKRLERLESTVEVN